MRTDHNVIGETHSLLTPLSVRLTEASSLRCSRRRRRTAARSETETAWVGRLCADPLRLGCAKARNGCGPRDFFKYQDSKDKTSRRTNGNRGSPSMVPSWSVCHFANMIFILIRSVCSRSGSRALRLGCSAFRAPVVPFPSRVQPTPRARAAAAVGCFCKLRPAASDVASRGPEIRVVVRRRRRGISPQTPIRPEIT
jgi:hypothetical protein